VNPEKTSSRGLVTVTGGAGYVGSVLVRQLLERGHRVRVLDNFLFGNGSLSPLESDSRLEILAGDVRDTEVLARAFAGAGAVIHLAGLVGDPACALDPELTRQVNLESSRPVAEACRVHGVERLLFASTCSVYGAAGDDWLDEESVTSPVSLYAETNLRSEDLLREILEGSGTALAVLRFATVFGVSPRMRFDLVVNLLTARAMGEGSIEVHGGDQWRPQVHVSDVANALVLGLDQPAGRFSGVFNVGFNGQNLRISELADQIVRVFPETDVKVLEVRDPRSYRVSFTRIEKSWGLTPGHDIESGVRQVADFLHRGKADAGDPIFHNDKSLRLQMKGSTE
jgi:nucleoside-diphosphate-sugar epimerase